MPTPLFGHRSWWSGKALDDCVLSQRVGPLMARTHRSERRAHDTAGRLTTQSLARNVVGRPQKLGSLKSVGSGRNAKDDAY